MEWETGSQLTLNNPDGDECSVQDSWFQVTSGDKRSAQAYAMKMYREGHEVIISRTGVMNPEYVVVYVIVHDSEEYHEQDNG